MDYLVFDIVVLALPAALLLSGRARLLPVLPVAGLAVLALLWTAPWDDHLVRSGVWSYAPDRVLARVGAVPVEEYAFVALEVLLTAAVALRLGVWPAPAATHGPRAARLRGAAGWLLVGLVGAALLAVGGHGRYLGLLLVWVAPPYALQRAVAGDVLHARRLARAAVALPVALWLATADRVAIALGTWTVSPASSTGWQVLGLPVEEALFFALTCLLVTDGLLLATDPQVLRRVRPRRPATEVAAVRRP